MEFLGRSWYSGAAGPKAGFFRVTLDFASIQRYLMNICEVSHFTILWLVVGSWIASPLGVHWSICPDADGLVCGSASAQMLCHGEVTNWQRHQPRSGKVSAPQSEQNHQRLGDFANFSVDWVR